MSGTVRVGLIGTSWWADDFLLPALRSHEGAVLTAICGRDEKRGRDLAEKFGVAQVFTDYREMIERAELDAVIVATPEDLHHPMVMAALRTGLHVLCEKPMAVSASESNEMLAAAESAGVKHMVQFTNRGVPHFRHVKRLLESGYVGEPYYAYFHWPTGWFPDQEVNDYHWAFDAERALGALNELGSHMIDLARWYLGDITRVSASLRTFVARDSPEGRPMETANDSAFLLLDFTSGAHAVIHVGAPNIVGPGLHHTGQVAIISGHDGTLETRGWDADPHVWEITGLRRGATQAEALVVPDDTAGADPADVFEVFRRQSVGPRLFLDAIVHDLPITPDFNDGHQVQRVIDAAVESHLTGVAQAL